MECPICQSQNEKNAQFCKNCGTKLHYLQQEKLSKNDVSGTLLIIFIIVFVVTGFASQAIFSFFEYPKYYEAPLSYIWFFLHTLQDISCILPALAIKNLNLKIIGIVLTSILVIFLGYYDVTFLLST